MPSSKQVGPDYINLEERNEFYNMLAAKSMAKITNKLTKEFDEVSNVDFEGVITRMVNGYFGLVVNEINPEHRDQCGMSFFKSVCGAFAVCLEGREEEMIEVLTDTLIEYRKFKRGLKND